MNPTEISIIYLTKKGITKEATIIFDIDSIKKYNDKYNTSMTQTKFQPILNKIIRSTNDDALITLLILIFSCCIKGFREELRHIKNYAASKVVKGEI